jgi:menaquinone-dependent protoporphyrinogen IX oxidase
MAGNILVVYYSRSGTTRAVAEALVKRLGCDVEEITESKGRRGWLGYVRSLVESLEGRESTTARWSIDPEAYDLVVIGSPVWGWSLASPVQTYLIANRARIHAAAFFCTLGATGSDSAFSRMARLAGQPAEAVCAITSSEVSSGSYDPKLEAFVAALQADPRAG